MEKKRLKIAYLSVFFPFRGGIAQFNTELFKALEEKANVKAFNFSTQYPDLLFPGKTQFVSKTDLNRGVESERLLSSINPLTFPKKISLAKNDVLVFNEIEKNLKNIGFKFEKNDENEIVFSGLPSDFNENKLQNTIEDIIESFKNNDSFEENRKNIIAFSLSKKLVVDRKILLNEIEMKNMYNELQKCEQSDFTFDGKPILMKIETKDLNKYFK